MRYGAFLRVSKNATMVLAGNMARMLLTMAFVIFAARYLGTLGYGKYALTLNLFEMFVGLSATGLCILVTRETAKDHAWLARNLAASLRIVALLSSVGVAILFVISTFGGYAPDTQSALRVASTALIPAALGLLAEAIFVAWEKAEFVAIGTVAESVVRTILCFALLWSGFGLISLFFVLILTRTAQLMFYGAVILRRLPLANWHPESGAAGMLLRQWRVFAAENWLSSLTAGTEVLLLSLFYGEAAVGVYDAAWKLIRLGSIVARSFTQGVFPYIARLYVRAEDTFHRVNLHSVKYILAALLPIVITLSVLSGRIIHLLYGDDFASSAPVLQVLAWLMIPQFLNPFLSHILFARHEQHRSLVVATINVATFLSLAFVLIPWWGAVGAAFAVLLSSMTAFGCYLAFCLWGRNALNLILLLARQTIAAGVLCGFLYYMRASDLVVVLACGAVLYALSLVLLRIVNWSDLQLLQELR